MAYPLGNAMYPAMTATPAPVMYNLFPGYEGLVPGATGGFVPPPPVQPMPTPDTQPTRDWSIPALTEEAAREAFCKYVDGHMCWKSEPARNGVITRTEQFNTYRYRMETYTESRKFEWATKPYDGQPVTASPQPPLGPWQIPVNPSDMFKNSVQELEVQNTSSVKLCDKCSATGRCDCTACSRSGDVVCKTCGGSGKISAEESCQQCNGSGKKKCSGCAGQGTKECETCKGKRQLLSFIKLVVEWKNNVDDYTVEQSSGLKAEKLNNVCGKQLFKDTKYMVYPLIGFPDQGIVQASERIIRDHQSKYSQSARILQQQQSVELIPVTKVTYQWETKPYIYFIYGIESKVKTDDYPETCCCCTIM